MTHPVRLVVFSPRDKVRKSIAREADVGAGGRESDMMNREKTMRHVRILVEEAERNKY